MLSPDIPKRLKVLREASGLSIRALAGELGMSSSGYAHYETPTRFKDEFLPMNLARDLARILAARGIEPGDIMALAGSGAAMAPDLSSAHGFAEDAARPWAAAPDNQGRIDAAIQAFAPDAGNPGTFQISRAIPEIGLLKGDIIIVDRKRLPIAGELALANAMTGDGHIATVIGRYLPPLLFTAESLVSGIVLDVSRGEVAVYHPIVASFRAFATALTV